ncbi:hypothetical protein SUGI_0630320 [Cryptomeria japonica]|nr:hypothetical protein SUGI_0630320 [Cryptomeria japonica]
MDGGERVHWWMVGAEASCKEEGSVWHVIRSLTCATDKDFPTNSLEDDGGANVDVEERWLEEAQMLSFAPKESMQKDGGGHTDQKTPEECSWWVVVATMTSGCQVVAWRSGVE